MTSKRVASTQRSRVSKTKRQRTLRERRVARAQAQARDAQTHKVASTSSTTRGSKRTGRGGKGKGKGKASRSGADATSDDWWSSGEIEENACSGTEETQGSTGSDGGDGAGSSSSETVVDGAGGVGAMDVGEGVVASSSASSTASRPQMVASLSGIALPNINVQAEKLANASPKWRASHPPRMIEALTEQRARMQSTRGRGGMVQSARAAQSMRAKAALERAMTIDWAELAEASAAYQHTVSAKYQASQGTPRVMSVTMGHRAGNPEFGYGAHGSPRPESMTNADIIAEGVDIAIKGGGAKGNATIGAMNALVKRKIVHRRLVGTSAGAFSCMMMAIGVPPKELQRIILSELPNRDGVMEPSMEAVMMDFPRPEDDSHEARANSILMKALRAVEPPLVPTFISRAVSWFIVNLAFDHSKVFRIIHSLLEEGGALVGQMVVDYLNDTMKQYHKELESIEEPTLMDLYTATAADLTVVATDVTGGQRLILNHRTAPTCPAAWAVRMSMALPGGYRDVVWRSEWGTYMGKDISGVVVVDGGIVDVFPMDLLLSADPLIVTAMGREDEYKAPERKRPIIGFLLDGDLEVKHAPPPPSSGSAFLKSIAEFPPIAHWTNIANSAMESGYHTLMQEYPDLVCSLPTKGYGTMELAMSKDRLEALINAAQAATNKFLDEVWPLTVDQARGE